MTPNLQFEQFIIITQSAEAGAISVTIILSINMEMFMKDVQAAKVSSAAILQDLMSGRLEFPSWEIMRRANYLMMLLLASWL